MESWRDVPISASFRRFLQIFAKNVVLNVKMFKRIWIIFATTTTNQHIRSKIKTHTHALAENDYILKSRNNNANHNSVLEKNLDCHKNIMQTIQQRWNGGFLKWMYIHKLAWLKEKPFQTMQKIKLLSITNLISRSNLKMRGKAFYRKCKRISLNTK